MPDTQRSGFHHIDLNVSDLQASRKVYGLLLEFLGYRIVKDDARGCEWDLGFGGERTSLGLRPINPECVGHAHLRHAAGLHHLAWSATSRKKVDVSHNLLIANGIPVLDTPAEYPEYSESYYAVFFEDPDGIKLELLHEE